jgi:helicase SWR1
MAPVIDRFAVITPNATADKLAPLALPNLDPARYPQLADTDFDTLHRSTVKLQIAFPDSSLLQYDCGKLQVLHDMLKDLKAGGHRVIIFTQMTKMLDILELFLSYNGHRYFRLDGGTKIEDRQRITERFNSDARIFAFIASTRAGGVGIKWVSTVLIQRSKKRKAELLSRTA